MRAARDQDRAVRDEQCPHAVCVRIDEADRLALESCNVRVIGICDPHGELARRDPPADLSVRGEDLASVLRKPFEKGLGFILPQDRK